MLSEALLVRNKLLLFLAKGEMHPLGESQYHNKPLKGLGSIPACRFSECQISISLMMLLGK